MLPTVKFSIGIVVILNNFKTSSSFPIFPRCRKIPDHFPQFPGFSDIFKWITFPHHVLYTLVTMITLHDNIYSPRPFAIIGELPLVNCSRYTKHQVSRIKTSLLSKRIWEGGREIYKGEGGMKRRDRKHTVLLVINFTMPSFNEVANAKGCRIAKWS